MPLTPAQAATLRTAVQSDPQLNVIPQTQDGAYEIARLLNLATSPSFIVWRSDVTADEMGNAWVGTDIDGMSALNMQRLQLLLAASREGTYDMRRADRRAGFENPFGTNQNNGSRVAMRAIWKRLATRIEKLFATGTGSDASPGILTFEGAVSGGEVNDAMGW